MQHTKKVLFLLIACLFFLSNVSAESTCDNKQQAELNKLVSNIKATYEETERAIDTEEYPLPDEILSADNPDDYTSVFNYFKISITNINELVYVEVSNNINDDVLTFTSANTTNGVATFDWELIDTVTTFTIKVYASSATNCAGEVYKTLRLTTPRFNEYYFYEACNDAPDFEMCQKYVTFKDVDLDTFMTKLNKYIEKNNKGTNEDKTKNNIFKEHKTIFVIGGSVLVVALAAGAVIYIKRRRSSEL